MELMYVTALAALIFSAFFSSMEVAFVASSRLRIELEKKNSPLFAYVMNKLTKNQAQFVTTMLVGNCCALIVYALVVSELISVYISSNIVVATIIASVVLVVVAEFLPKSVAQASPNWYLKTFAAPLYIMFIILYPVSKLASVIALWVLRLGNSNTHSYTARDKFNIGDLQTFVDQSVATSPSQEQFEGIAETKDVNLEILQNALYFPDLKVRDCMVPRVEISAYDISGDILGLCQLFETTQFTRVPLYDGSLDNIVGYANSRDIFRRPSTVASMRMDVTYTSESTLIKELLLQLIKTHKSLAVVIDEYGGASGVITIEDILEQIVGEIEDEHDTEDSLESVISDGRWVLSGRLEIGYLNEKYKLDIPESDMYETLAGFIVFSLQELPVSGAKVVVGEYEVTILKATSNRITLVELRRNT